MQRSAVHAVNQGAIYEELTARAEVPNIGLQRQPNRARFGQAKPASPDGAGDSLLVVNHQHRAVLQFHRGRVGAEDRIDGMRTRPGSSVVTADMQRCLWQPMSQENLTASQPREMRAMAWEPAGFHRRPTQTPVAAPSPVHRHLIAAQGGQDPTVLQFNHVCLRIQTNPAALPDGDRRTPCLALVGRAEHPAIGRVTVLVVNTQETRAVGEFTHRCRYSPARGQHTRLGVPGPAVVAGGDDRRLVLRLGPRSLPVGKETAHQDPIAHPGDVRVTVVVRPVEEHPRLGPCATLVGRADRTNTPTPRPIRTR